jgi:hypothetical protein
MTVTPEYLSQIDRLVAEKVMGFVNLSDWQGIGIVHQPDASSPAREIVPQYSSNPAAAKQVREKLKERGLGTRLDISPNGGYWATVWSFKADDDEYWLRQGATEELAQCLAALKAVGVEL